MLSLRKYHIILASQSPRRHELMRGLDIPFEVVTKPVSEDFDPTTMADEVPVYLAQKKIEAWADELRNTDGLLILTADTVVILDGHIIGKPENKEEAANMLQRLSGKTHKVVTGVCISSMEKSIAFSDTTLVTFKSLSQDEINYYLDKYEPYDKAGSYGVQEWIGYIGVTHMDGSYFNVMGLPVHKVYNALREFDLA